METDGDLRVKESRTLEFKEEITNSFLKTVSAFSNYGGGSIVFGIRDDGSQFRTSLSGY